MSWIERIETGMIIQTGDGQEYEPLYMITEKTQGFNVAEYNFPNVPGTLVKRSERTGIRYSLEIIFQGENQLDISDQFEQSARDPRFWVVSHPMHGRLNMQPTSLKFNNKGLNTTVITGEMVETITEDSPKVGVDPQEQTKLDVVSVGDSTAESFATQVPTLEPSETNLLSENMDALNSAMENVEKTNDESNEYFNLFNTVNSAVLDYTAEPLIAMTAIQDFINYPSLLQISVSARLDALISQFTTLVSGIGQLLTPNDKKIFENNAANVLMAMVNTTMNPFDSDDYGNAVDVLAVTDQLSDTFSQYVAAIDSLQTDNGGNPDSYIPDFESVSGLANLIDYAISNLFQIALNASQERRVFIETDSNAILLAHKYYGLTEDDSTIDEFIRNNNIGLSEILQIRKGREIVYYV
jgi:hypothetical protein